MKSSTSHSVLTVVSALFLSSGSLSAASSLKLTGSIAGVVRNAAGVPQMGATVLLFSQYERVMRRALTNDRGAFGFDGLLPELYSLQVDLPSFVPAMKQKISVQPGMQSLLYINMASLLSSIELVYAAPGQGALMSDDWKWTLKSAISTRPILRFLPEVSVSDPGERPRTVGAIFSDTRGLVRVSAGDGGSSGDLTAQPDLGTAFALATSLFGRNQLQVSGNVGHTARSGLPAASFRTSYSHDGAGPQIAVTMHQVYLPARTGMGLSGSQQDAGPTLRTMSFSFVDRLELSGNLRLEYGTSFDSVVYIDHLNYFSPFARLSYDLGTGGTLRAAYSSGAAPAELFSTSDESEAALHQDLTTLSLVPRVSLRGGRAKVQRTQSFEIGYEKKLGSRTFGVTAYRELVANGALTLSGGDHLFLTGDILPDFSSASSTFNVGGYQRYGYSACVSQSLGEKIEIGISSGRGGVFAGNLAQLDSGSGEEIRSKIHTSQRYWAAVRGTATVPVTGTRISTSYEWMDANAIMPTHLYLTQSNSPEVGWNIQFRQPIRGIPGVSGRLEATADLRNLFAQGYLPLASGDARRVLLMQAPRAVRGGLSFIF